MLGDRYPCCLLKKLKWQFLKVIKWTETKIWLSGYFCTNRTLEKDKMFDPLMCNHVSALMLLINYNDNDTVSSTSHCQYCWSYYFAIDWNKVMLLCGSHQLLIKAVHLRPDPALATQECSLRVSLQPLRLNIDQVHMHSCPQVHMHSCPQVHMHSYP